MMLQALSLLNSSEHLPPVMGYDAGGGYRDNQQYEDDEHQRSPTQPHSQSDDELVIVPSIPRTNIHQDPYRRIVGEHIPEGWKGQLQLVAIGDGQQGGR